MDKFNASKGWTILLPSDVEYVSRAAEDLSRCIGFLSSGSEGASKAPVVDAFGPAPDGAVIVLSSGDHGCEKNGYSWRAGDDRVEISGDSGRGLCNGIYGFLSALGISWPAPEEEVIPKPDATIDTSGGRLFPLAASGDLSPSDGILRRFVPEDKAEVKKLLGKGEAFVEWAARNRYDAIVFPLAAYAAERSGRRIKQLAQIAGEYGITLEAGGWELSSLVPRWYFLLHRDFFRMEDGKRNKDHHFCPTNPDVTRLIAKEGGRLFRFVPEGAVINLWPDKGAETAWCSCPSCRAFSALEQNRIAINAAADALAALNRGADREALISYFEKPGEGGKIKPRKNTFSLSEIP
jgi:hypothetical protein